MTVPETPPQDVAAEVTPACPQCGAPLQPGQDWCLNCGAAVSTEVLGTRGWRAPIVIVGVVLLLAAAGLVYAFLQLNDNPDQQVAKAPTTTPTPAATTPAPVPAAGPTGATGATGPNGATTGATGPNGATTAPPPTPSPSPFGTATSSPGASPTPSTTGSFASWPAGHTAWTVILWSATTRSEAETKAKGFQSQGKSVGILHSDDYSSLNPGYWVVYSGDYPSKSQAQSAADGLQSTAPGAYARHVKPK